MIYDNENDVMQLYNDAEATLKLAYYKMAEADLARGTFEEKRGNKEGASIFYFSSGSFYRLSDAPKETIDVADIAYRRCGYDACS